MKNKEFNHFFRNGINKNNGLNCFVYSYTISTKLRNMDKKYVSSNIDKY